MPKKTTSPEKLPLPSLLVPRDSAREKIQLQIEKGKQIRIKNINSKLDLDQAQVEQGKWSKYNTELLSRLFDNSSIVDEYNHYFGGGFVSFDATLLHMIKDFQKDIDGNINRLEAILDRLDLIPEIHPANSSTFIQTDATVKGNDIFLVHGHDEATKEAVARYIEKLGLKTIVLHEQPNSGKTIIEKFENYSNVGFAVVLLTPDDKVLSENGSQNGMARARQNVVFELGYFIGKLTRQHVCALYKEGVEIPSDINGVLYIPIDTAGAWRLLLARELKQAGLPVDLNKAI